MSKAKTLAQTVSTGGALENPTNVLLDSDIGSSVQAYDADLTSWAGKTAPSGDAVGTSDTQTLTNKTISAADNTLVGVASTGKAIAMAIVFG